MVRLFLLTWLALFLLLHRAAVSAPINFEAEAANNTIQGFNLSEWLFAEKFALLEKKLALVATNVLRDDAQRLPIHSIAEWADTREELNQPLLNYCSAYPNSFYAHYLRGLYLNRAAWSKRGTGAVAQPAEPKGPRAEQIMQEARRELELAAKLNSKNQLAYSMLINTGMGLGLLKQEIKGYFERAIVSDATYYAPYYYYLQSLQPKWGGTADEAMRFARQCLQASPPFSQVHLIIVDAHRELAAEATDGPLHWKNPEVWDDVQAAFKIEYERRKSYTTINNYVQYAVKCGQIDIARTQFERIGFEHYEPRAWANLHDFLAARAKVFEAFGGKQGIEGQYQWLLGESETMINRYPKSPLGYYYHGSANWYLGNSTGARADLEKVKAVYPNDAHLQFILRKIEAGHDFQATRQETNSTMGTVGTDAPSTTSGVVK